MFACIAFASNRVVSLYIDVGFVSVIACNNSIKYAKLFPYFSDDSTISYQNVISGVTVWPKLPLRTVFKYLITEGTRRKKPQQVIRANIVGLCIEWNKCEAIPYFWSYFLITPQRMDFVVVSPMDLLHLFHWPRLLQLNVHQFVRISWLSFPPFRLSELCFSFHSPSLFLFCPTGSMCNYAITIFPGLEIFSFSMREILLLERERALSISGCPRTVRRYVLYLWPLYVDAMRCDGIAVDSTASNETLYVFICSLFHFPICCENSFSLSPG